MPERTIDFDGEALRLHGTDRPVDDTSVAVTLHELRTLMALLPEGDALPVASRGDLLVLMPGSHTLPYVVALARMRPAVSTETPENGAQVAQEPVSAPGGDPRLDDLAESLQQRVEAFVSNLGVDPHKYDHQNVAGELVSATLGILRNHGYLSEPESADDGQRAPLRRHLNSGEAGRLRLVVQETSGASAQTVTKITGHVLALLRSWSDGELEPEPVSVMDSPAGARSLRQATRDGYLTQRDQVERALDRALEGRHRLRDRVMRELDEVLAR